jgi:hypothetical protein
MVFDLLEYVQASLVITAQGFPRAKQNRIKEKEIEDWINDKRF